MSLKDKINEDVEVGTNNKSEHIQLILTMERQVDVASFDYACDIDDVGQIVFTPKDQNTSFVEIRRAAGYDSTGESIIDNTKEFYVSVRADMISEDDNFDWFVDIDEVGQAVITPDSESTSFLTASVDGSLNLITEAAEDKDVASKVAICAELVKDADKMIKDVQEKLATLLTKFSEVGITLNGDDTKYIEDFDKLTDESARNKFIRNMTAYVDNFEIPTTVQESIVMESQDNRTVIDRFMRGEITIVIVDKAPENTQLIPELTNTFNGNKYEYYYDEESDTIGVVVTHV